MQSNDKFGSNKAHLCLILPKLHKLESELTATHSACSYHKYQYLLLLLPSFMVGLIKVSLYSSQFTSPQRGMLSN